MAVEKSRGAHRNTKAQTATLRSERDRLRSERDRVRFERDRLKSESEACHTERAGLTSERDRLRSECDELRGILTTLTRQNEDGTADYEWHVDLAAKGMAERDNHPMPDSVTTPAAFYTVMAGAALEAIGLRALLERVTRAEGDLEALISDTLTSANDESAVGENGSTRGATS